MGTSGIEPASGRRFSLVRTLGEGSFGVVYLAEMEGAGGFKRRVALKLLNETWDPDSDAGRRLRDEARLLGRLEHRHIVRVDDLVQLNGRWALVMEYVSGADMERVFGYAAENAAPLTPRAVVELLAAVAGALVAAWSAPGDDGAPLRVVHRDIKPSNIRLSDTGDVKVLDFGVARAAFSGREARTERVRYGSIGYMSPERLLGEPEGAAGDVYALGVVAWELLTLDSYGRAELGPNQQEAQVAAAREKLVGVIGEGPLVDLIVETLAYEPDARPEPGALEERLRAVLGGMTGEDLATYARRTLPRLVSSATTDSIRGTVLEEAVSGPKDASPRVSSATLVVDPLETATGTTAREAPTAPRPESPLPAPRRAWIPIAAGAAVLLALLAVGAWRLSSGAPEPSSGPTVAAPPPTPSPAPAPPTPAVTATGAGEPSPAPNTAPVTTPAPAAAATPAPAPSAPTVAASAPRPRAPAAPVSLPSTAIAPAAPAPVASPPPASDAPRLRAAKFTLEGAEGLRVTCGDVTGSGMTSALLRDFPAGDCVVVVGGKKTTVRLDDPRGVACTVAEDTLTCR